MKGNHERPDASLLAESVHDPRAFMEIFERHVASIHRYVHRQLGRDAAEDATSEVFRRALAAAESYEPRTPDALPWLLGIARNVVRAELRDRYAAASSVPLRSMSQPNDGGRADNSLEIAGELAEVQALILDLPVEEREPLLLYAWFDLPYQEIAVALDLPIGTVRSRIARVRSRLRRRLGVDDGNVSEMT